MKTTHITAVFAALLLITTASMAATVTPAQYKTSKADIVAKYKQEKTTCKALSGNAKDICNEQAKGSENVAKAELLEEYQPSVKHRYAMRMARADADYAVAKEKCDDAAGNVKDVCRKEAKSVYVTAKADAKVAEKTSEAIGTASDKVVDARKDAATDKNNAAYAVAKEKCDALSGDPKDACIKDAKMKYGQR
ncbi:hypothetical protein [Candidatus Aalborgicola defluviihabitans]|jgi:hypothetical protein|uniref:hypothetical protein n=1 Tax=Candidatus Aalborgicola defluviihabitans TaxID=3386187 RepID=UPI001DC9C48A|nr:hypothetical protein [Burkholderiales bacterium]MBK7280534.1 hypothetical protein [Burkholderiales bacterium]MBK7313328.1 hypothetical protein [Burkholderiales bacterium]MBL0244602.1 hypothetical protein [Rhodoferax sp.]